MGRQGAGALKRKKERRAKEKRSRRESNQAKWQRLAADGANTKSRRYLKRIRTNSKGPGLRTIDHGNIGCLDGNFSLNIQSLTRQKLLSLAGYQNQWSSKYSKQVSEYIRNTWPNLETAWAAYKITPLRQDVPESYNEKNWKVS
jgi:hypothetical protein